MANFADRAGATAYLVSAALETAGYGAQSRMLDEFNGAFGSHLAGLFFVIAIVGALIVIASGGSYRYGLWLLLGPPIFYFLIQERMVVQNAEWKFGDRVHPDGPVDRAAEGLDEDANVSKFFAYWDKFTSDLVQELIRLLHLTEKDSDLQFLRQSDRFHEVYNARISDRNLMFFMHMSLVNRCSNYFQLQRLANDPFLPAYRRAGARDVLTKHPGGSHQIFSVDENRWILEWYNSVFGNITQDQDELRPIEGRIYSCDELWRLGIKATKKLEAGPLTSLLCSTLLPDGLTQQECQARLAERFGERVNTGNTLDENAANQSAIERLNYMTNELAARLVFREMFTSNRGTARIDLSSNVDTQQQRLYGNASYSRQTGQAIRDIAMGEEYTARGEIIAAAINLPYFQGMILYFLAWTFPFFAMIMIIPGRESVIMLWMSLWFWVKLWDFGFAVVMMIDNMLYALLPHSSPMDDNAVQNPGSALNILLQADPSFSAYTYYTLISACIFSVPVLTGLLVKKGGGELVAAVSQGIRDFPADFGRAMGGRRRAELANEDFGSSQAYIYNSTRNAMWDSILRDPAVMVPMLETAARTLHSESLNSAIAQFRTTPGNGTARARLLSELNNQGNRATNAIIQNLMSQASGTDQRRAVARAQFNMQMAAYTASNSQYVRQLAQTSVMRRWNSHDYHRPFPGSTLAPLMQAELEPFMWQGGVLDTLHNEAFRAVDGANQGWFRAP